MSDTAQTTTTDDALLLTRRRGAVLHVRMNRPSAANSLSTALLDALLALWAEVAQDETVSVVVLEGAGKIFCAGHDLREIRAQTDPQFHYKMATRCTRMMMAMKALPQPVIAKVHGAAVAAGCQLVANCDLAVAADHVRFSTPGVNIGVWCSTPMVAVSRRIAPKHALQLLLTGRLHDAQTAFRMGLVNEVVPADRLDQTVDALADEIASKSRFTLSLGKRAFYRQLELDEAAAYEYAAEVALHNSLAEDAAEGVQAFIDGRPPVWKGR